MQVRDLQERGTLSLNGRTVLRSEVSEIHKGDIFAYVIDTKYCQNAVDLAKGAKLLLCESTYLEQHKSLALYYAHMTSKQAATIGKQAGVQKLILTHFSARYLDLSLFAEEAKLIFPNVETADDLKRFDFPKGDFEM